MRNAPKMPVDSPKDIAGGLLAGIIMLILGSVLSYFKNPFFLLLALFGIALMGQSLTSAKSYDTLPSSPLDQSTTANSTSSAATLHSGIMALFSRMLLRYDFFSISKPNVISKETLAHLLTASGYWQTQIAAQKNEVIARISVPSFSRGVGSNTFTIKWRQHSSNQLDVSISSGIIGNILSLALAGFVVYTMGVGALIVIMFGFFASWFQFRTCANQLRRAVLASVGGTSHNNISRYA